MKSKARSSSMNSMAAKLANAVAKTPVTSPANQTTQSSTPLTAPHAVDTARNAPPAKAPVEDENKRQNKLNKSFLLNSSEVKKLQAGVDMMVGKRIPIRKCSEAVVLRAMIRMVPVDEVLFQEILKDDDVLE